MYGNLVVIWYQEESTEAPGALLGRTYGDGKGLGVLRPPIKVGVGVTQGYPVSTTIFNIVFEAVVRAMIMYVCR